MSPTPDKSTAVIPVILQGFWLHRLDGIVAVCLCVIPWIGAFLKRGSHPGRWACVWACDSLPPALQSCCLQHSIEALQTQQVWKHLGSVLEWIRTVIQTETMWPHNENTCRFGRLLSFWLASIESENYNFFLLDLVSVFIGSRAFFCSKVQSCPGSFSITFFDWVVKPFLFV